MVMAKNNSCVWNRYLYKTVLTIGFSLVSISAISAQDAESNARRAMISSITGNMEQLRGAFAAAQGLERSVGDNRAVKSSDIIFYLYNCSVVDRELFLSGQEVVASNAKDNDFKNRVLVSLLSDEVYELNRLEGQNRFNRFSRVFNRASTGLSQLVLLQPQAAVSMLWDGIYSVRKAKSTTVKERKMIYLCNTFLKKYPNAPEKAEVEALKTQLIEKLNTERAQNHKAVGKKSVGEGKLGLAEYSLERATLLGANDDDTKTLLQSTRTLRNRVEEARSLSLGVSGTESRLSKEVNNLQADACRSLITGMPERLAGLQGNSTELKDSIEFALAASAEKNGQHESAIRYLISLSQSQPQTAGGKAAKLVLQNPKYNLDKGFETALAEMSSEKTKFIWTGNRSKDETVYVTGNAAIQSAGNAAMGVPILFGMDAGVRAISEQFRTQINVDSVVDAGAQYLRRYPGTPRSKEIADQLARLNKKAGEYKKSESYFAESGTGTPEDIAKLNENLAIKLFENAKQSTDLLEKRRFLKELMEKYGTSKIAQKSGAAELAKIPPSIADDSIVVMRKALVKDPTILHYLGIPRELADDKRGNSELSDEGISINLSSNNVEFQLKNETTFRQVPLAQQGREWIVATAMQLRNNYELESGAKDAVYRQKIPFSIDGGAGASGIDIAPQLINHPDTSDEKKRFK